MCHPLNWFIGWSMVLAAFLTGAAIGIRFHQDDFLGGYVSFRRRLFRLGHIALAALGVINVVYALSPFPEAGSLLARLASLCFIAGGLLMPAVCFLSGWREAYRKLFFIPVLTLVSAVIFTLIGGWSS